MDFVGAKAALFCGTTILTYLRDQKPGLPWPGLWDLPGGGREGQESPVDCLLRELHEEFGLHMAADRLVWQRTFPSMLDASRISVFFAGQLTAEEIARIRFGDEGQRWEMMPVTGFLQHEKAVPEMRRRAQIAWTALA